MDELPPAEESAEDGAGLDGDGVGDSHSSDSDSECAYPQFKPLAVAARASPAPRQHVCSTVVLLLHARVTVCPPQRSAALKIKIHWRLRSIGDYKIGRTRAACVTSRIFAVCSWLSSKPCVGLHHPVHELERRCGCRQPRASLLPPSRIIRLHHALDAGFFANYRPVIRP